VYSEEALGNMQNKTTGGDSIPFLKDGLGKGRGFDTYYRIQMKKKGKKTKGGTYCCLKGEKKV